MQNDVRWDLTNVYPGPESDEFKAALAWCVREKDETLKLIENVDKKDFKNSLITIIKKCEGILDEFETIYAYTNCLVTVNTVDKVSINANNKAQEIYVGIMDLLVSFNAFIAENKEQVRELTKKGAELEDYAFIMENTIISADHQMSKELENLASDLNRSGCDAFSRLQESVSSSACATLNGEKKTVIQLRTMATDKDREVRKAAYDAEVSVWKEHEVAFAAAINGVKGACLTLEKRRGWKDPLERSAFDAHVNLKVIDALISALESSRPMFEKYLALKAKALGIDQCAYWDIFAPVGNVHKHWSFEEMRDFITAQYAKFNPEQGKFVQNAFEKNWIDLFPRANKTGGGYDTYLPKVKESRIFINFNYDYDGVFTVAHELGHAWHDHVVSTQPALIRSYPMTLAETASIFGEFITFQGALSQATDEEKMVLIENYLGSACQVCIDILARFYFERELFKRRAEGELVPEELCQIMVEAQHKAYGKGIKKETIHPYMWAVKGHYYNEGFSFYNYPYAFGQLFGLGLYKRGIDSEKLNAMLSITGKFDAMTVAKTSGIDIESPEFWQEGLQVIKTYVDQFEALCK